MKDTKASIFWTHWIQLTALFYSPSYASSDGPSFWRKPKAPSKWNSACLDITPSTTFPAFAQKSEAKSHSQLPGPTFRSYRWHAIYAADVSTDAHIMIYVILRLQLGCIWYQLLTKCVNDFSFLTPVYQYYGEKQDIWKHGHSFLSWSGKESI